MRSRYGTGRPGVATGFGEASESRLGPGVGSVTGAAAWCRGLQHGVRRVQLHEAERARADREAREVALGEIREGEVREQVVRKQGLAERREEPGDRGRQREPHRPRVRRLRVDLRPEAGHAPGAVRVLERVDRVDHVIRGDRDAVLPRRVGTDRERPGGARGVARPGLCQVGRIAAVGRRAHEAREDQTHERPVGTRPRRDWRDGGGRADDAFAVRHEGRGGGGGRGLNRSGRGRPGPRERDRAPDDDEDHHQRGDDRAVPPVHAVLAQGVPHGGRDRDQTDTNDTRQNRMNSTSSSTVNCQSLRSTPRRLR